MKGAGGVRPPARREGAKRGASHRPVARQPVWLFDLDNTLHDATGAAFGEMHLAIGDYIVRQLGVTPEEADALRQRYWRRYGATLLGLVRHHGIRAAHFLEETHRCPASRSACAAAPTTGRRSRGCRAASSS